MSIVFKPQAYQRAILLFKTLAVEIAPSFSGIDPDSLPEVFEDFWSAYDYWVVLSTTESASDARADLLLMAAKADELAAVMKALGKGAVDAMQAPSIKPEMARLARTDELPDPLQWGDHSLATDESIQSKEAMDHLWERGGPWVCRLEALAKLGRSRAAWIEEQFGKGGRRPFGDQIHGSPEGQLAHLCTCFAIEHGCRLQPVVVKIVQAIMDAHHGTKPGPQVGRKAVRRAFQTYGIIPTV